MNGIQTFITIMAVALGTMVTRFLPFILFPDNRRAPKYIIYLGKVLPPAVISLLVVYCMKGVSLFREPYGIPEILSAVTVAGLHVWKKNTLLSIAGGTVLYMILVQLVFI